MEYDLCCFLMDFPDEEPIQMSGGGMIFNQRVDRKSLKSPQKASRENKNSQQELQSAKKSSNVTENESKSSWPSFADEDYIGFCFRDDGGIDLDERNAAASADQGGGRRDRGSPTRRNQKGEERGSTDLPPDDDDIKEITTEVEETTKWKSVPASSSGSTRSNSSSSSFAFPVMNWESKSSPQRMPQLEEQLKARVLDWEWKSSSPQRMPQPEEQLKVRAPDSEEQPHKAPRRFSRFHCCRF